MRKFWTENQIEILREHYPFKTAAKVSLLVGRCEKSVYQKAKALGVKKDPAFLAELLQAEAARLKIVGVKTRFPKGNVSFNKGKKGITGNHPNTRKTQFRAGHKPVNHRPVGSERVSKDGYLEIKVAEGMFQWRLKHRVIWEAVNGAIPKGFAVTFKDGDQMNCVIENLELKSRQELMERNTIHRYPEPVKGLIHQMIGMRRRLNDYGKKQNTRPEKSSL